MCICIYNIKRVYVCIYTYLYTHTHTHTYLHKSLKRISVFSQLKGHPYFRITFNTIMISLLLSVTFATRMLDFMSWNNKLHSSQLKIKEAIQFKMSLKINIVSVWKEQIWGDSSISPPLFGIQVKHTSNVSGKTPNWIIIMPIYSANTKVTPSEMSQASISLSVLWTVASYWGNSDLNNL